MADRIDIGAGPRLGFDPTDTGGFEYTGQKALTADEYASRYVNFQREFLGLPDLAEESGIETGAPEVGQDIDVTKDEASGPETDLIGVIGDTNTYNFDAKKDGFQPKFGYQETGASEFSSYSDYLEKSGKMDRVNLVEKIYEPLMKGDFKDIDFSALGQEAREGVQAIRDAPQTLSEEYEKAREEGLAGIKERIQKGAPKALAGLFSSLGGISGSVIGSVIGGTDQLDEFGDPSRRPSGPLSVLYDARMSRAFDIMNDIKSAHNSGTMGDRGYAAKLGGGRKLLRARGARTYFDMGGLTFEQAKNIEAFNEGYIVDTYSFDQEKGKDFFGRDKNVKVEDIGGAFAGRDGYYTPDGRYYSTRYQTTSAAGPASGISKVADKYGVDDDVAKQAIMDARAGKGTVKGNIDKHIADVARQEKEKQQRAEQDRIARENQRKAEAAQYDSGDSDSGGVQSGYSTDYGGSVGYEDPSGAAMVAMGGRIGMAAGGAMAAGMGSGFVDRPPSQVPEEQTVADDVETQMPEGAFVINAAAVEFAGEQDIKKMLNDAQKEAVRRGITIDNPENSTKLIDVAISRGEVMVAPYLAKIIGYDRLNKINNRGKPETKERLQEAAQGGMLDMANGGTVTGPTPRPSRPDMSQLGDVEFRADLDVYLQNDPLARLGYNMYEAGELELESVVLPSEEQREIKLGIGGMYIPKESRKSPSRNERFFQEAVEIQQGPNSSDLEKHAVIAFTGKNVNLDRHMGALTMLHELRHAAITHLEEKYGIPRPPISSEETMMDIQDYMNRLDARKVKASIPKKSKSQFAEEKKEAAYKYDSGMKRQLENFQKLALGELKERGVPERQPSIPQEGFLTRTYKSLVN
tara:strand:- start:3249 stop:5828 length:2580 start_codon:yes stop_codon:yes gene_type:complete